MVYTLCLGAEIFDRGTRSVWATLQVEVRLTRSSLLGAVLGLQGTSHPIETVLEVQVAVLRVPGLRIIAQPELAGLKYLEPSSTGLKWGGGVTHSDMQRKHEQPRMQK